MKTRTKVVVGLLAVAALVWIALGYLATQMHNHYLIHVRFQDRAYAQRMQVTVGDSVTLRIKPSSAPLRVTAAWTEQDFYRKATFPFLANWNGPFFGRIHLQFEHPTQFKVSMPSDQGASDQRSVCVSRDQGQTLCEITVWDSRLQVFRGGLVGDEGQPLAESQFEVSVTWRPTRE